MCYIHLYIRVCAHLFSCNYDLCWRHLVVGWWHYHSLPTMTRWNKFNNIWYTAIWCYVNVDKGWGFKFNWSSISNFLKNGSRLCDQICHSMTSAWCGNWCSYESRNYAKEPSQEKWSCWMQMSLGLGLQSLLLQLHYILCLLSFYYYSRVVPINVGIHSGLIIY